MFCSECGARLKEGTAKFCPECGFSLKKSTDTDFVPYESVQEKSVSDAEKVLSTASKSFAGYGVIHAVVSLFLWHSFTGTGFRIVLLMLILAAICLAISYSINKKSPVTEHFKFKCQRCNEENIIPADTQTTFECKKCEKKFVVVENKIKTID